MTATWIGPALWATTVLAGVSAGPGVFGDATKVAVVIGSIAVNAGAFLMA